MLSVLVVEAGVWGWRVPVDRCNSIGVVLEYGVKLARRGVVQVSSVWLRGGRAVAVGEVTHCLVSCPVVATAYCRI